MSDTHLPILIIEDEYLLAMEAERILRDLGLEVGAIWHSRGAAGRLEAGRFGLVLVGLGFQSADQVGLLERLRELRLPTVVAALFGTLPAGFSGDGLSVVAKPFEDAELAAAVAAALGLPPEDS